VLTSSSLDGIAGARLFFNVKTSRARAPSRFVALATRFFSLSEQEALAASLTQSSATTGLRCFALRRGAAFPPHRDAKNAPSVKVRAIESYGGKITFCEAKVSSRQ